MTRDELKDIVVYAYASYNVTNLADQTIEMSIDYLEQGMPRNMTLQQLRIVILRAIKATKKSEICPVWFNTVVSGSQIQGTNHQQDEYVETRYPAPTSYGSDLLDAKISFMTLWGMRFFQNFYNQMRASGKIEEVLVGQGATANPNRMKEINLMDDFSWLYRFLMHYNVITEPEGWEKEWRPKAKAYLIGQGGDDHGSIKQILQSMKSARQKAEDDKTLLYTMKKLRVLDVVERMLVVQPDSFSQKVNDKTSDLEPVWVIQDNTRPWGFYLQYLQNNEYKTVKNL